jgi:hypothetical protein
LIQDSRYSRSDDGNVAFSGLVFDLGEYRVTRRKHVVEILVYAGEGNAFFAPFGERLGRHDLASLAEYRFVSGHRL